MVNLLCTAWISFCLGVVVALLSVLKYADKIEREEEEADKNTKMMCDAIKKACKEEIRNEREAERLFK